MVIIVRFLRWVQSKVDQWAYPQGRYRPPDLSADWPDEIQDEDAIDHLYTESRQRLGETIAFGEAQEAKGFVLLRVSLILIVASGILGAFQIDGLQDPTALVSLVAIGISFFVLLVAFFLVGAQSWDTGVNAAELAAWSLSSPDASAMKAVTLETLVESFNKNYIAIESRGWRLRLLTMLVALQAACVVSIPAVSVLFERTPGNC